MSDDSMLAATGRSSDAAEGPELASGAAVGRYIVLGTIGAGAMGVIYSAHHPELDRKVALKMLLADGGVASAGPPSRSASVRSARGGASASRRSAIGSPPEEVAEARFVLARALAASGQDRGRAVRLAEQARDTYRGAAKDKELGEVEAWLAAERVGAGAPRGPEEP